MAKVTVKVETTLQQRVDAKKQQCAAALINLDLAKAQYAKYSMQLDSLLQKLKKEVPNA